MLRSFRLSVALQRWELLFVTVLTLSLSAGMLWIAWQASQIVAIDPACFGADRDAPRCRDLVDQLGNLGGFAGQLLTYTAVVAFGSGLVLGVPLVAREIEHGTADLAWSLSPSRMRWLLPRVVVTAGITVALLGTLAIASDVVAGATLPDLNLGADFTWYGQRGVLLVMCGLLGLGIGLGAGAIFGRQLPALLIAVVATAAVFVAVNVALDRWLMSDASAARFALPNQSISFIGSRSLGGFFQVPGGALVTMDELEARGVHELFWDEERSEFYATLADRLTKQNLVGWQVDLLVPGEKYGTAVLKQSLLLAGLALGGGALAFAVVNRRRPY